MTAFVFPGFLLNTQINKRVSALCFTDVETAEAADTNAARMPACRRCRRDCRGFSRCECAWRQVLLGVYAGSLHLQPC
ncbi:hypothetical protein, partial [Citrobacter freundii]|uniref:hypothetical protein n=1 Tax=Citrobacter freundii TaxID=546 RepID=UPI0020014013